MVLAAGGLAKPALPGVKSCGTHREIHYVLSFPRSLPPLLPRIINLFVQITPGGMPRGHEIVIILPFGYIWRMTDFPTKFSMHIHN